MERAGLAQEWKGPLWLKQEGEGLTARSSGLQILLPVPLQL